MPEHGQGKTSTVAKIFLDTNILVYTLDSRDPAKQRKARKTLREAVDKHSPVISTQVLQEFYVAATVKLKADPLLVKGILHAFRNMETVNNDPEMIEQAIDISILSRLSFWDSLIVAAAEKAGCEMLFSEDLSPGQTYRGIRLVNPFHRS